MDLTGASVIVTGGSRGIGKEIARLLAEAGAKVVITGRTQSQVDDTAAELRADGLVVLGVAADITDDDQVQGLVRAATEAHGPTDILVNSAGGCTAMGPTWEVTPAKWKQDMTTNLYGTYLCCHAVLPSMVARGRGYVTMMTGGGANGPMPFASAYGASKLAILGLGEAMARSLCQ